VKTRVDVPYERIKIMEVEKPVITKEIQVIEKKIEVPVEVIVYKEVIKEVPIVVT